MKTTGLMIMIWLITVASLCCCGAISQGCTNAKKKTTKDNTEAYKALLDKYEHVGDKPLGAGACAAAWKVKEKGDMDDKFYVSKECHGSEYKALYTQEINTMSLTSHPNIATYRECFGKGEVGSCMVIEFIEGKDMNKTVYESYPDGMPSDVALDWFIQMASAIKYLHTELFMCHRDLHGGNWMVSADCKTVKLVDFGTAIQVGAGVQLPRTFSFMGFASPEVLAKTPSSYESDIWYLGMAYAYLIHPQYELPFFGTKMVAEGFGLVKWLYSIPTYVSSVKAHKPLKPLPASVSQFNPLIARMLDYDMDKRATITEVVQIL